MWLLWWGQYRRGARVKASFGLILPLVAMGALGYVGQSFAYFSAAARLPAAATGLLLFTYPILVTLLARLFFKEALTPPKLAALVVSTLGTLLVLGIFTSPASGQGALGALNPEGVLWGLSAAAIYSVYIIAGTRFAAHVDPFFSSAVIITSAAVVYMLAGLVTGGVSFDVTPLGIVWALGIAFVCTILAISAFFAGLKQLGPSRASIVSTVEPALTVVLAALALHEQITVGQVAGGALILLAVLLVQLSGGVRVAGAATRAAEET
jgi:drug/metabolite transporter (DMT)-like permease